MACAPSRAHRTSDAVGNVERLAAGLGALRNDARVLDWEATLAGAWVEPWDPKIEYALAPMSFISATSSV